MSFACLTGCRTIPSYMRTHMASESMPIHAAGDRVIACAKWLRQKKSAGFRYPKKAVVVNLHALVLISLLACTRESGEMPGRVSCVSTGSRPEFIVATYNIHAGVGRDGRRNIDRVATTLVGAQFVGLQEVDNGRLRSGFADQVQEIAALLGHSYNKHFQAENYWPIGSYGNAVSTSFPVIESGMFDLPIVQEKPLRRMAWVKFLVDCRPVHAYVVHISNADDPTEAAQQHQVEAALAIIDRHVRTPAERHIFMGDFNAAATGPTSARLKKRFVGALDRSPESVATPRVDYVFVGGDLEVIEAYVRNDGSSDHPAIFARLR